jgi:hypothetical protein
VEAVAVDWNLLRADRELICCSQKTQGAAVGLVRNGIRGDSEATVARSLRTNVGRIERML